jgi:hypothetical protein
MRKTTATMYGWPLVLTPFVCESHASLSIPARDSTSGDVPNGYRRSLDTRINATA